MKNISLKAKLLVLTFMMTLSSIIVGGVSSYYSNKTIKAVNATVDEDLPAVNAIKQMLLSFRVIRIELLQLNAEGTTAESDAKSMENIENNWKIYDEKQALYEKVSEHSADEDEKKLYAEFEEIFSTGRKMVDEAVALYKKNPTEGSPERRQMAKLVAVELQTYGFKIKEVTEKMVALQNQKIKASTDYALSSAKLGTTISILVTLICAFVGLAGAFIFATRLSRQMDNIISSISVSSREVATASTQIARSSEELSQATTEQAASLSETAASLEEINAMIGKASESAAATEKSSAASQAKAQEGRQAVDQMLSSIEDISRSNDEIVGQVNNSNQQMTEIVRVIQEIGNKTKVINEIVFQTKLLSFNASVEAARAGEHGKGFAVVAEEVGNLAQMSGNAAKEISEMLDGSISKVENIVKESKAKVESLVESGKQKVEIGVDVARQCSAVLDEIVKNVSEVSNLSQEISQASREQSQGVGEINKAMGQLDTVTQQNSSTSEQAASAAEELSAQAGSLRSAVEEMAIIIRGGISSAPTVKKSAAVFDKKQKTTVESKSIVAQSEQKPERKKSSNVISLAKSKKKPKADQPAVAEPKSSAASASEYKMASGESTAPSRDSDGFDE